MRKTICVVFVLLAAYISDAQSGWKHGRLKVTTDGHFLQYEDGTPFFWLGDTGWELFHRLKKEEIDHYLENRSKKGFNVIQAVVLAEFDGLTKPNQYGEVPLIDLNAEKPNEKYFELVDWTIKNALARNMFIGLLPTWGDKIFKANWGKGPVIFNESNAYNYGLYLGKRYKEYPNIIWIAGGDRPAFVDTADFRPIYRAMIKGIREGTGNKALITYHPWGETSTTKFWKDENILDVNMMQSGHARQNIEVWEWIKRDWELAPPKPVLDAEPNYEDHPINWNDKNGYFRDYDVRRQTYRSVFSGGCGVTYGNQAVWQFYSPREEKVAFPDRYWTDAINRPGAFQVGYLKKLIESRSANNRVPDQSIIVDGQGEKAEYITAFRDGNNKYAMIYIPVGRKIAINTSVIAGDKISASWFNPKDGKTQKIGNYKKESSMNFTPPTTGVENDWVLIIERG